MAQNINGNHPLRVVFAEIVEEAFAPHTEREDVKNYVTDLLVRFMHEDDVYKLRDAHGRRIESLAEMIAEGDIRLRAESFEREREVNQHIGDFLLFWTGMFPERPIDGIASRVIDPLRQGSFSYYVASSFDHPPYTEQSRTLLELSEGFRAYMEGLHTVRRLVQPRAA